MPDRVILLDDEYDELHKSIRGAHDHEAEEGVEKQGAGEQHAVHSRTVQLDGLVHTGRCPIQTHWQDGIDRLDHRAQSIQHYSQRVGDVAERCAHA